MAAFEYLLGRSGLCNHPIPGFAILYSVLKSARAYPTVMSKSSSTVQETRNNAPVPLEPSVQILNDDPVDQIMDAAPPWNIDIDQLKDELGLGDIQNSLQLLSDKIIQLSSANRITESVAGSSSSASSQFDPSGDLDNIILCWGMPPS